MNIKSYTGIVDYGVGNLRSVFNAIKAVGGEPVLSDSADVLLDCDRLVLPGVGAFPHGMAELQKRGLGDVIKKFARDGRPILGICLGMQLLALKSYEFGETKGLGLAHGEISLLRPTNTDQILRLPHVAWKQLRRTKNEVDWLFDNVNPEAKFYFIHSYAMSYDSENVVATSEHDGVPFGAVLRAENVVGTQFHPEKSGPEGLKIIRNFIINGKFYERFG